MYQRHQKLVPEPTIVHCSSALSSCPEKYFPQTKKQLFDVKSVIVTFTSNESCNVQDVQNSHTSVSVHINNRNGQNVFFFQSLFKLCDKSLPQNKPSVQFRLLHLLQRIEFLCLAKHHQQKALQSFSQV